jgi:hypothetical protein
MERKNDTKNDSSSRDNVISGALDKDCRRNIYDIEP